MEDSKRKLVEARRASQRRWAQAHPEKKNAASRKWRAANKEKVNANKKLWMEAHPGYGSNYSRKFKYSLTPLEFKEMALAQNNCCLICGLNKKLCVDHDHITKRVRGLLCRQCNCSIGLMNESIEALEKMIGYLKRNS
jgi:hypothetical protein